MITDKSEWVEQIKKPHLHEQKDWHGTSKFQHRVQANSVRHSSFTRAKIEVFLTNWHGTYFVLAPLIFTNDREEMFFKF